MVCALQGLIRARREAELAVTSLAEGDSICGGPSQIDSGPKTPTRETSFPSFRETNSRSLKVSMASPSDTKNSPSSPAPANVLRRVPFSSYHTIFGEMMVWETYTSFVAGSTLTLYESPELK